MNDGREFTNSPCMERSGFLFPHACTQIAATTCDDCGKPICYQHTEYLSVNRKVCIACARSGGSDPSGSSGDSSSSTSNHAASGPRDARDDNPYWYSAHYYQSNNWNQEHEFTEGDEGALGEVSADDFNEWEKDLGAS